MTNAVSSCLVTWSCVINAKLTTMDLVSIETVNCALAFFLCAELTETHSSGAISLAIDQNAELVDLATTGEEITEFMLGGSPWDVADED